MRPGAPATFSAEQWCQIIALACEPPEASGRPISHWTPRELADEACKRGIVATISKRWLSMTASFEVEVAPGEDDLLILASVLALDLAIDAEHDH